MTDLRVLAPDLTPTAIFTDEARAPAHYIESIQVDHRGRIWAGTRNGVVIFDDTPAQIATLDRAHGIGAGSIIPIVFDERDQAWLGVRNHSVSVVDPDFRLVGQYTAPSNLLDKYISDFYFDTLGRRWVRVWSGGLVLLNEQLQVVKTLRTLHELPDQFVMSIAVDRRAHTLAGMANDEAIAFDADLQPLTTFPAVMDRDSAGQHRGRHRARRSDLHPATPDCDDVDHGQWLAGQPCALTLCRQQGLDLAGRR